MFGNHIKVAVRNLLRHKGFSFINIVGLAVGIAGCLLILQYVNFELSYDNFHENADNIYRVRLDQYANNELIFKSSENYPGAGPALKKELPEVLECARLYNLGSKNNVIITYDDAPNGPIQFKHRRFLYADATFPTLFSYRFLQGDPATALEKPLSMVISETYAKKYFGDEDPLGKKLHMKDDDFNDELCQVTGVVEDPPANTHLKFDILISYNTLFSRYERAPERYNTTWGRKDMYTYILVKPGTDPDELTAKFPAIIDKYSPDLAKQNRRDEFILQPLRDIHLHSVLTDEAEINGDGDAVYFLLIISFFIVLIAWINYINLSTARALERAKEVGLRKVVGADRAHLVKQFLLESAVVNLIAIGLALVLVTLSLQFFNQLAGMSLSLALWRESWFWVALIALSLVGSFLAGGYPAFVLSSFRPVTVLRGKFTRSNAGTILRRVLVVFQFAASIALIAGTFTVFRQLNFMRSQELGYNMDQIIVVERPGISHPDREKRNSSIDAFRAELKQQPGILGVTSSSTVPGKKMRWKVEVRKFNDPANSGVQFTASGIDYDFFKTFEMDVIAGRQFSQSHSTDADTATIITESAARMLGFASPEAAIGQTLRIDRFRWNPIVIGVTKDFHQESLKLATNPLGFYLTEYNIEYYMMKVSTANLSETIDRIQEVWDRNFPGNPFQYFFLDDYFDRQYQADQKFGQLFATFAALALFVGSLGLFGLSAFTTQQRTKEIGVRKVLGASTHSIIYLLSQDIIKLVLTACLIAWPIIHYVMQDWLANFAYRVQLGWLLFPASGLLVMMVALLTVGYETFKAAMRNPTESLQYE